MTTFGPKNRTGSMKRKSSAIITPLSMRAGCRSWVSTKRGIGTRGIRWRNCGPKRQPWKSNCRRQSLPDPPIIQALPDPGEEWQPEDIILPRREPLTGDPSEIIDRMLPLIEAALGDDPPEVEYDSLLKKTSEDSAPMFVVDPSFEAILNEYSAEIGAPTRRGVVVLLYGQRLLERRGSRAASGEYVLRAGAEPPAAWEEEIAQTVLDTYTDIQPLLWDSMADAETQPVAPPPRGPKEERILDPGDAGPFEELRKGLEEAVKAAGPAIELIEETPAPRRTSPAAEAEPSETPYDIVLPDSDEDEEPAPGGPVARADAAERPYKYLFSKLRRNLSDQMTNE